MQQAKSKASNNTRGVGRPKLGSWRLECMLSEKCLQEVLRREQQSGQYRTRICAAILERELVGDTTQRFNSA
jgi:hypothetical protein